MLVKYQEAKEAVAEAKAALVEQQEELETSKYELELENGGVKISDPDLDNDDA